MLTLFCITMLKLVCLNAKVGLKINLYTIFLNNSSTLNKSSYLKNPPIYNEKHWWIWLHKNKCLYSKKYHKQSYNLNKKPGNALCQPLHVKFLFPYHNMSSLMWEAIINLIETWARAMAEQTSRRITMETVRKWKEVQPHS